MQEHGAKNTLIPVFVASRVASSNGLYMGLNATVNAQSTIRPAQYKQSCIVNMFLNLNTAFPCNW